MMTRSTFCGETKTNTRSTAMARNTNRRIGAREMRDIVRSGLSVVSTAAIVLGSGGARYAADLGKVVVKAPQAAP
jgi:hypothetical protein